MQTIESPASDNEASPGRPDVGTFLAQLFTDRESFLERDRYQSIGDAEAFFTKAVGVTFEGRQDIVGGIALGQSIELRRDPTNPYDSNAIGIWYGRLQVGFIRKEIARRISPNIDTGAQYEGVISSVTGGGSRSFGINLHISRVRPKRDLAIRSGASAFSRAEILAALVGDRPLRDSQKAVLARVETGARTLAVLGTGRGKSLCFQFPAAVNALEQQRKTVVLYPLRALANDQFEALVRRLDPLGVRILRANGSIGADERSDLFSALDAGTWDIVCATPEFFTHHLQRFTGVSQPHLVVIDEAHHLHSSRHRPAYGRIAPALSEIGSPQVLALTATAGDEAFKTITSTLGITSWVIDPTVRVNLQMIDARGVTNKLAYIIEQLRDPGKAIIYCNSRSEATKLAEKLRSHVEAGAIAFYHAGVPTEERTAIEQFFRNGDLRVVVATSAFGEGIDLPDIRNVFLYHLNFSFTEFNQQSGRAGRDGDSSRIHLMFGEKDKNINEFILARSAPTLYMLREIYRELKRLAPPDGIRDTFVGIADTLCIDKVDGGTISLAVRIFVDEGLATIGEDDDGKYIRIVADPPKVDLTRNERFAEGEAERDLFQQFSDLILRSNVDVLEMVVNRPIYPTNVPLLS